MTDVFDPARYRLGTFALIDRVAHQASYANGRETVVLHSWQSDNPDPGLYRWDERHSQWRAEIPVDRCERVYSVHIYGKYRDQRVLVEKVSAVGSAVIIYAGWDGAWATENAFLSQNSHEYYKTVPLSQVKETYEKHDDLLFSRWRSRTFSDLTKSSAVVGATVNSALNTVSRPRSGQLASLAGLEYQVLGRALGERLMIGSTEKDNPDSRIFAWHPQRGLWTAMVPVQDFERVVEVTTRAEYVGYPCEVASISPDGMVELYFLGEDPARAAEAGFTEVGNKWINTVSIFDIARYHEFHQEL